MTAPDGHFRVLVRSPRTNTYCTTLLIVEDLKSKKNIISKSSIKQIRGDTADMGCIYACTRHDSTMFSGIFSSDDLKTQTHDDDDRHVWGKGRLRLYPSNTPPSLLSPHDNDPDVESQRVAQMFNIVIIYR